ncbi:C6 zinc finger domain-containing protein [Apiospora phragmitis]|uniref:C6 zinc finger domain-containing protein n=1 Tax=Apiospora phragmitis TaxID=2905665 RepID=A0ABR1VI28_9PEZI
MGRKGSRKVRTGCVTCKCRKVKCDERRPECMRCIKAGRPCGGYRESARTNSPLGPSSPHKIGLTTRPLSTLPGLSSAGGDFWPDLVLQFCHSDPPIRHAVFALSSFHESLISQDAKANRSRSMFGLEQYNIAIGMLRNTMGEGTADPLVPLLINLLFISLEYMQMNRDEALNCIMNGRKLLSDNVTTNKLTLSQMDVIKQHIVPLFARAGVVVMVLGLPNSTTWPTPLPQELNVFHESPAAFFSVKQARDSMYVLADEAWQATLELHTHNGDAETALAEDAFGLSALMRRLQQWYAAFAVFKMSAAPSDAWSQGMVCQLEMAYHTTYMLLMTTPRDDNEETGCNSIRGEDSTPQPTTSLSTEGSSVESMRWNSSAPGTSTSFSFDVRFIATMFFVATKCRHPILRRSALKAMYHYGMDGTSPSPTAGRLPLTIRIRNPSEEASSPSATEDASSSITDDWASSTQAAGGRGRGRVRGEQQQPAALGPGSGGRVRRPGRRRGHGVSGVVAAASFRTA